MTTEKAEGKTFPVTIKKGRKSLGVTVTQTPAQELVVESLAPNSAVAEVIKIGDRILSVQNEPVKTVQGLLTALKNASDTVTFVINRRESSQVELQPPKPKDPLDRTQASKTATMRGVLDPNLVNPFAQADKFNFHSVTVVKGTTPLGLVLEEKSCTQMGKVFLIVGGVKPLSPLFNQVFRNDYLLNVNSAAVESKEDLEKVIGSCQQNQPMYLYLARPKPASSVQKLSEMMTAVQTCKVATSSSNPVSTTPPRAKIKVTDSTVAPGSCGSIAIFYVKLPKGKTLGITLTEKARKVFVAHVFQDSILHGKAQPYDRLFSINDEIVKHKKDVHRIMSQLRAEQEVRFCIEKGTGQGVIDLSSIKLPKRPDVTVTTTLTSKSGVTTRTQKTVTEKKFKLFRKKKKKEPSDGKF